MIEIIITKDMLIDLRAGKSVTNTFDVIIQDKRDQEINTDIIVTIILEKKLTEKAIVQKNCFHTWKKVSANMMACTICEEIREMY
jgi:hypothetical protein